MPTSFRDYHPDAPMLLPVDVREWLSEDELCYRICELVDQLDLGAFYAPYEGDGRRNRPYDPAMLVKLLCFAYADGTFSSRQIARKLKRDLAYRYVTAGSMPAHRTICEFRRRHLADFQDLFLQIVQIAAEMGQAKLGSLAVDGSKVKAAASKRKAMSYDRMREEEERLRGEIAALLQRAEREDAAEDVQYGLEGMAEDVPAELKRRQDRLARIEQAKARLEARARRLDDERGRQPGQKRNPRGGRPYRLPYGEPEPKAQSNFTDPESSIMKTSAEGFQQCYNAQAAVDSESRIIVATTVTANASDAGNLLPMIDQAAGNVGRRPAIVLADAGYADEKDFADLEDMEIDAYVAQGREGRQDPEQLTPARQRMAGKLATPEGKRIYAARKHIAEPPFGWIKQAMGFRRFSVRGLAGVTGEWFLVCLALNARRISVSRA